MRDAMLGVVFWEGHVVDSSQERADGSLLLSLSEDPSHRPRCGRCGSDCVLLHERRRRLVRDRDWWEVLDKLCTYFRCRIEQLVVHIPDDQVTGSTTQKHGER